MLRHIRKKQFNDFSVIIVLFIIIFLLEYSTPPEFVFGYLYIGPILLASIYLNRRITIILTIIACFLTFFNAWFPFTNQIEISTIANRLIANLALIVTAVLSYHNQLYQRTVSQQQAKIQAQETLANLREDFASTLTHDLKTPLLGAIETLKAFQQEIFGNLQPAQRNVLSIMIRSHQNTLQMVEMLLDIYRNDNEGLRLNLTPLDLVKLAEEVMATLTDLAASRRVYLSLNYGQSDFRKVLWVNGDEFQLRRVLSNLLLNAINHSPRGEKVEIMMETDASYQIVKVLDRGAGVPLEDVPYVFERFYQSRGDRQAKGTGLGLYLSRQIIEAHGGNIWVENGFPVGAVFSFKLPILPYPIA